MPIGVADGVGPPFVGVDNDVGTATVPTRFGVTVGVSGAVEVGLGVAVEISTGSDVGVGVGVGDNGDGVGDSVGGSAAV